MAPPAKKIKRALILSGGGARGAYQIGVWKYLIDRHWKPDLICGTSVGAINSVGIGSGLNLEELIQIWRAIERGKVYRISLWQQIRRYLSGSGFVPLMDTEPFKAFLLERLHHERLRESEMEIIITAVNILTSELKFFSKRDIDIEHVMASSAIPILFPWQYVDGAPHWDGGVMANTPILPALERGAKEIIVVLLSPVGGSHLRVPRSRREAIERVFEQSLNGSYEAFMSHLAYEDKMRERGNILEKMVRKTLTLGDVRIATVAPSRMLGFYSILNFSNRQVDTLLREGYTDARGHLGEFFGDLDEPY